MTNPYCYETQFRYAVVVWDVCDYFGRDYVGWLPDEQSADELALLWRRMGHSAEVIDRMSFLNGPVLGFGLSQIVTPTYLSYSHGYAQGGWIKP